MAAAKSGDVTVASGAPWRTYAPGLTRIRMIGPENGASTCVETSPLKATVPVVWTDVRNGTNVTASPRTFANWAGVRATSTACPDEAEDTATAAVSLARFVASVHARPRADEASTITQACRRLIDAIMVPSRARAVNGRRRARGRRASCWRRR